MNLQCHSQSHIKNVTPVRVAILVASMLLALSCLASVAAAQSAHTISVIASTVPSNGDVNPYGIFVVPDSVGNLVKGDLLISNFNAASNKQGTGTTIVQISPSGTVSQFAQISASSLPGPCPGGVGLTTALAVLRAGWVIVGSLPTKNGSSATAKAGCLLVLDPTGNVAETIYGTWHGCSRRERRKRGHRGSRRSHPLERGASICGSDDRNWLRLCRAH